MTHTIGQLVSDQYIRKHKHHIGRITNWINDAELAEELVQDAYVRALGSSFDPTNPQYFDTWFYKVLNNVVLSYLNLKRNNKDVHCEYKDNLHRVDFDGDAPCADADRLISTLPPNMQPIMHKRVVKGMTNTMVAELLGITPGYVKCVVHHATKLLKERYEYEERWRGKRVSKKG